MSLKVSSISSHSSTRPGPTLSQQFLPHQFRYIHTPNAVGPPVPATRASGRTDADSALRLSGQPLPGRKDRRLRPKNIPLKIPRLRGSRLQSVPPVVKRHSRGRRNCPPAGSDFLLPLRYVPRCRLPNSGRSVTPHELSGRESIRCFDLFS